VNGTETYSSGEIRRNAAVNQELGPGNRPIGGSGQERSPGLMACRSLRQSPRPQALPLARQLPTRLSTSENLPLELAPETAIVTCSGEELELSTASPVNCTPLSGA